jgi:tetratricopeptide (TPR) repeat protein
VYSAGAVEEKYMRSVAIGAIAAACYIGAPGAAAEPTDDASATATNSSEAVKCYRSADIVLRTPLKEFLDSNPSGWDIDERNHAYQTRGDFKGSKALLEIVIGSASTSMHSQTKSYFLHRLADAESRLGEYGKALEHYRQSERLSPERQRYLVQREIELLLKFHPELAAAEQTNHVQAVTRDTD